jgi:hypothetical protein
MNNAKTRVFVQTPAMASGYSHEEERQYHINGFEHYCGFGNLSSDPNSNMDLLLFFWKGGLLGMESGALHMLDKQSATEIPPRPARELFCLSTLASTIFFFQFFPILMENKVLLCLNMPFKNFY